MIKLQVKVISWLFIILTAFLCVPQIESINTNFLELAAFEDFLRSQHLSQVLVVRDGDADGDWHVECHQKLLSNYRVQFYRPGMSGNFEDLMFYGSPRTAVLVLNFRHILVGQHVLRAASEAGYFNNSLAWFILGPSSESQPDERLIEEHFSGYSMGIDADITVVLRRQDNISWLLYDVYRISSQLSTPLIIEKKGQWSAAGGYQLLDNYKNTWVIRRRNFGQITLQGSTVLTEKPPGFDDMAYLADESHLQERDPMQRKNYQLFRLIESMYNLSLAISFTDKWGELLDNGSWSGVMGLVLSGAADFAVSPMRFVVDRQPYIQYSAVLHTQDIHFIFRHPRHSHIRNIFFEPLSIQVWWCVVALITGSTLLLLLHVQQERRLQRSLVESRLSFVWFSILETYLQQGPNTDVFRLFSTRILISFSCIFSFMLMQFYGAFIVGSLLSESPRSIVSLQDLYDSNMVLGMENISYNFAMFTNTSNQLVKKVFAEKICEHNIMTLQQGADRVIQGRFAFHTAIDRIYRLLKDLHMDEGEFCELQEIRFNPTYTTGSVMPKGSPWREHIAHALLHLHATGLKRYNDKKWIVRRPDCSLYKASKADVDLEHFAPALFTLVLAIMGSAVVFMLELLVHWLPDLRRRLRAMST
ncbi:hypothetical protein KR038_012054 [Drosophila bunnanda]|nr:hypothetical protein KR038_012054 [Drosophila bunnanda]